VLESNKSLVLFMDSDSSLPIENLDTFLACLDKGYDVVIASRNIANAKIINQQKGRKFLGSLFSLIVGLLIIRGFTDTQCGFKLFRSSAAQTIFPLMTLERFSFDVEALFIAKKKGYKIAEAPVSCIYCDRSSVNPLRDGFRMFRDILKIRINDLRGFYKP
jgi:dolichyl-phosphate beta-glucosyltransferase